MCGVDAIQWLRDNLKLIKSASDIEALARTVDDSGGLYVVPAFAGADAAAVARGAWNADGARPGTAACDAG